MKHLVILVIFFTACSTTSYKDNYRGTASIKESCTSLFRKLFPQQEETAFEESRRAFMRGAAASVAVAAMGPGQIIKVAASGAGAISPERIAILRKATKLRKTITISGTETYKEALVRASQQPEFSEVSNILIKRAGQIQERLGAGDFLKNLPARVLEEGTQTSPNRVFDFRIQRRLTESRIKTLKGARLQLLQIREDLLEYLEHSMLYQLHLYENLELDLAALVHLVDNELMAKYQETLIQVKEVSEEAVELYPRLDETVDELLAELEG